MKNIFRFLWCLGGSLLILSVPGKRVFGQKKPSSLHELNRFVLKNYDESRTERLKHFPPYIIINSKKMILTYQNKKLSEFIIPEIYSKLKSISHIILGFYSIQYKHSLGFDIQEDLNTFELLLNKAKIEISSYQMNQQQLDRAQKLLGFAVELIHIMKGNSSLGPTQMDLFYSKVKPLIKKNIYEASEAQIQRIFAISQKWKQKMSKQEWGKLRVIVGGQKMLRQDHLPIQTFAKILNLPPDHPRLIFAEGINDPEKIEKVLATFYIETDLSDKYFHDPLRMTRDLLGDATKDILDKWTISGT